MDDPKPEERVPRIGRGRLRPRFPLAQINQILMLLTALAAVVMLREGCGAGVANWFKIVAPDTPAARDAGR